MLCIGCHYVVPGVFFYGGPIMTGCCNRNMQEKGLDVQTSKNEDHFGALIHHLSLVRNKRCLTSYMYVFLICVISIDRLASS